jgi:hypothetical protein
VSVPRSPASTAGIHPVELVARSQKRPELRFASAADVDRDGLHRVSLRSARTARAHGLDSVGRFKVDLLNNSNQKQTFTLEGRSADGALNVSLQARAAGDRSRVSASRAICARASS